MFISQTPRPNITDCRQTATNISLKLPSNWTACPLQ